MRVQRVPGILEVVVADGGCGLPEGFDLERSARLGLQIVRTLVEGELQGRLTLEPGPDGGTEARLRLPLD